MPPLTYPIIFWGNYENNHDSHEKQDNQLALTINITTKDNEDDNKDQTKFLQIKYSLDTPYEYLKRFFVNKLMT